VTVVVEIMRTFLEMRHPSELRGGTLDDPRLQLEQLHDCPPSFYRYLYNAVGERYHWIDRLDWSDEQIRAYLARPGVELWLLAHAGAPAGYYELRRHDDDSVEIVYFGLLQEFLGLGLGKHLLTLAVERAWAMGARRVWLHTCSLDDPAALPNDLKRGFTRVRYETYQAHLPEDGKPCER
jgi:GNAT superfamily N-acetyltransferase